MGKTYRRDSDRKFNFKKDKNIKKINKIKQTKHNNKNNISISRELDSDE